MADRKQNVRGGAAGRGRKKTLLWVLAAVAVVIALIATEQVALLYVLATLSVAALLVVVAMSDLGGAKRGTQPAPFDDAAAIADGHTANAVIPTATRRTTNARRG